MTRAILAIHISRGMAPVASVGTMAAMAVHFGCIYDDPIIGKPLVYAKNLAVARALEANADLLMMEDDILADHDVWRATMEAPGVTYARCRSRDGRDNVYTNDMGGLAFTGNVFTRIPHEVLTQMPKPVFQATDWRWTQSGKNVRLHGSARETQPHSGSDIWFWYHVLRLSPAPEVTETGRVIHLKHSLNLVKEHSSACLIEEW